MVASWRAALETRSNSVRAPLCFLLTLEALDSKETRLFHLCLHSGSSKPMISYSPNVSSKCLFVLSLSFQGLGQGWGGRAWRRGKGSSLLGEEEQCQLSLQQPGGTIRTQGMFVTISKSGLNCFGLNWLRALSLEEGFWLSHFWSRVSGVVFFIWHWCPKFWKDKNIKNLNTWGVITQWTQITLTWWSHRIITVIRLLSRLLSVVRELSNVNYFVAAWGELWGWFLVLQASSPWPLDVQL